MVSSVSAILHFVTDIFTQLQIFLEVLHREGVVSLVVVNDSNEMSAGCNPRFVSCFLAQRQTFLEKFERQGVTTLKPINPPDVLQRVGDPHLISSLSLSARLF